ncbi:MAG: polysaccharide deacetylase family protein [Acidobacteria bacterium]|nr:polysaccharide deacetylase family protein [Acidobacteriota bacterium]
MTLDRGVFTISIDFELLWGTIDKHGPEQFRAACLRERKEIIDRLLSLFEEFEVAATWCIVGHLFLSECRAENGHKHPEIVRPTHAWLQQDWFTYDPCDSEHGEHLFLGRSLVEKIRACPVPQEIGCHTFSHVIFGDTGCSRATAVSELAECVRLAREMGIDLRSFAFPRDRIGHLDVLSEYGFACYRGREPHWYEKRKLPNALRRLVSLGGVLMAAEPPLVLPEWQAAGIWNIPGSMIYFPNHGFRRYIPMSLRVRRAVKGLKAAVRTRKIFHLWFHPTNLADDMESMFLGLRAIMAQASEFRAQGKLIILPMGNLVPAS